MAVAPILIGLAIGFWPGRRSRRKPRSSRLWLIGLILTIILGSGLFYVWRSVVTMLHIKEGWAVIADTRMLAGSMGARDGERRISKMIEIAKSRIVAEGGEKDLRDELGIANPEKTVSTLKAERVGDSDLVRIKVRSGSFDDARNAASVLASEAILRCKELGQVTGVKLVQSAEAQNVLTLRRLETLFLFGWPVLMLLIGLEIGYPLGRRLGRVRSHSALPRMT